jgi:molybdopterin-containing oxidoreductase family membrane subunit
MYSPTFWDWATLFGSLGLVFCLLFLFLRVLPVISMSEMRELVEETEGTDAAS